jgi:protein TonB
MPRRAQEQKTESVSNEVVPLVAKAPSAPATTTRETASVGATETDVAIPTAAVASNTPPSANSTLQVTAKSKLLKYVPPVYPHRERSTGAEGWVDVNFLITSDGRVIEPRVGESTVGERFHRAAIAAVTQWKFSPAPDASPHRPMHVRLDFRLK